MSFARMPRQPKHTIDVDRALELWHIYKNWAAVAAEMLRPDGKPYTQMSVYMAVWRVNRLPDGAKRMRPTGVERDMTESSLSHHWRPGREKWLPVRPDYRTNRIIANEPRMPPPSAGD